jgi:hypothetical protein
MLAIPEALRWLRLRVGFVGVTREGDQAGHLVFPPLRLPGSAPEPLGPPLVAAPVHLDGYHRGRVWHLRGEPAKPVLLGPLVPGSD